MSSPKYDSKRHRDAKARFRDAVEAGQGWCAETICLEEKDGGTRYIPPGSRWHAAHTDDGKAYKGPAHARCNLADGARRGNAMRGTSAASGFVTVVAGAPCSGKSTYIAEHHLPGDVVVDFDHLAQALGAPARLNLATSDYAAVRQAARDARAAVIAAAKRGKYGTARVWIIQTWAGEWPAGVEIMTLNPGADVCHERATVDGRPQETHDVIDQWYSAQGEGRPVMHEHAPQSAYRRAL